MNKESPEAIAEHLGIPGKARTIRRYKTAVWDLKDLVAETKEERAERHDSKREAAKVEIVKTIDLIEKIKSKANQHLDYEAGGTYTVTKEDGTEGHRRITPGQAINWHAQAADMACKAAKIEMELSGDDPNTRAADSFLELVKLANKRGSS